MTMRYHFVHVAALWGIMASGAAAEMTWTPAPSAEDFVDSIGVCTHWSYRNTIYGKSYEQARQRLAESGIRNIRDGWDPRLAELWRDLGIRTTLIVEPEYGSIDQQIGRWKSVPGMVAMIEGPNEPNLFWPRFNKKYKGESYPKGLKLWQDDLYRAIRADADLSGIPVTSPTPIFDGAYQIAPLTSFDYLALHPYAGGRNPAISIDFAGSAVRSAMALVGHDSDLKPLIATESGYHNASGTKALGGGQAGISEAAGGKYFPRHFAEYWNAGFARTFVYEFLDERVNPDDPEANFGLLHNDLSPKPSYTAVSNMISILGRATWDRSAMRWVRETTPPRAFQVSVDAPAQVHHSLLSASDGSMYLLLWQEALSYDLGARKDLSPPEVPATISLPSPFAGEVYRPLTGKTPLRTWEATRTLTLGVPDEMLILHIATPPVPATANVMAPIDLQSSVTATSAKLAWKAAPGAKPVAYLISRLGRPMGSVPAAADGSATFTDSSLIPGLGYAYSVFAVSSEGLLSAPAMVMARTPNQRPDLVVKGIRWEPASPRPGDEVRFFITIANVGVAPTPAVTHGVAIRINGTQVLWSDTRKEPLAPGESCVLATNNGPSGKGTWTCTPGTFRVDAVADDVNRIDESNEQNNGRRATLSTGVGADLTPVSIRLQPATEKGKPPTLVGIVKNIGTAPTPKGVPISCTFTMDDPSGKPATIGFNVTRGVLAPGQQVELGIPWPTAKPSRYTITATADDIDRIAELDETNNRTTATIEVP